MWASDSAIKNSRDVDIKNANIFWNRFSSREERAFQIQRKFMKFQWNPRFGDANFIGFLEILFITHNSKIIQYTTRVCNLIQNLKLFDWLKMALKLQPGGVERKTEYVGLSTTEELLFFHYCLTLFSWNHPRIGRQRFKYYLKHDLEIPSDVRWSIEKVRC